MRDKKTDKAVVYRNKRGLFIPVEVGFHSLHFVNQLAKMYFYIISNYNISISAMQLGNNKTEHRESGTGNR